MRNKTIPTLIISIALAAPAYAGQAEDVTFTFKSHEVETTAGAVAVYDRMARRAEQLCTTAGFRSLSATKRAKACSADLVEDFIVDADSALLRDVHQRAAGSMKIAGG